MTNEIEQTMSLAMFIYELVELRDRVAGQEIILGRDLNIALPQKASVLLKAGYHAFKEEPVEVDYDNDGVVDAYVMKSANVDLQRTKTDAEHDDHIQSLAEVMNSMGAFERAILDRTDIIMLSDDEIAVEESRVFLIAVDHIKKRIIVTFRGSSTKFDWQKNANVALTLIDNPAKEVLKDDPKCPETVQIHGGFLTALLGGEKKDVKGANEEGNAAKVNDDLQVPLDYGKVRRAIVNLGLLEKGYDLYVTGHSLGGAMATLFGFFAASDDAFTRNGPVIVYSYASPRVGDVDFQSAFKALERAGRIRHARIRNHFDKVTMVPFAILGYRHVGLEITLKDLHAGKEPKFDYPLEMSWRQAGPGLFSTLFTLPNALHYHSCREIFIRLKFWKNTFNKVYLEDKYNDVSHKLRSLNLKSE